MTYFIEGLSETRLKKISSIGINLTSFPLEMSRRKDVKGHLIEEKDLEIVLKTIKAEVVSKTPSNVEGVTILKIKNKVHKDVSVKFTLNPNFYWDGFASQKRFRIACEELLDGVCTDIICHVIHGKSFAPYDNDSFNIYIWSSPENKYQTNPPRSYFGLGEGELVNDKVFAPNIDFLPITDENNNVCASFNKNHLYIHFDIIHNGYESEELIFRKILSEFLILHRLSPEEIESRKKEMQRLISEKNKNEYVRLCKNRYFIQSKNRLEDNKRLVTQIAELERAIHQSYRDLNENQMFVDTFEEKSKSIEEKLLSEYEKILGMSKIKSVSINNNHVSFFTTMIDCVDDRTNKVHEIGEFEIIINLNPGVLPSGDSAIKFINLTRVVRNGGGADHYHPHVPKTGIACQGNLSQTMPKLLADLEIEMALLMAIQFLESANTADGWGRYINLWPEKTEKTSTMVEVES